MLPHSLVTVTAASKALIAAFLVSTSILSQSTLPCCYCLLLSFFQFVIHHVSMEHAMKLLLPVTVQTTLKALTAVHPVRVA